MSEQLTLGPTPTRVGHVRHDEDAIEVYVGRGSKWGNPYVPMGRGHLSRYPVIESPFPLVDYEAHVRRDPALMEALPSLRGKVLGCYCVRLGSRSRVERCHAQVLARMADTGPSPALGETRE